MQPLQSCILKFETSPPLKWNLLNKKELVPCEIVPHIVTRPNYLPLIQHWKKLSRWKIELTYGSPGLLMTTTSCRSCTVSLTMFSYRVGCKNHSSLLNCNLPAQHGWEDWRVIYFQRGCMSIYLACHCNDQSYQAFFKKGGGGGKAQPN